MVPVALELRYVVLQAWKDAEMRIKADCPKLELYSIGGRFDD